MPLNKPKLEILYSDLVEGIQHRFVNMGLMKPIQVSSYLAEIDSQVLAYREVYGRYLRAEWDTLFPKVQFSDDLLNQELTLAIKKKKDEALSEFKRLLKRQEKLKVFSRWIFRKWDLITIGVTLSSFITFPVLLSQFFATTNWQFHIGLVGILANFAVIGFCYSKSYRSTKYLRR